ncbi:MAG TPA: DUF1559 domain-containing protein, partial [Planctomicrobium sp.]|nr:DUF1559 domain-containing protein [Planctomicrobium sp.]
MIHRTRGFTLAEMLIVLGVISILVAILLPVIQSARDAARRTQCSQHLRQIGSALLRYHDTHKSFPSGQVSVLQQTDSVGRFADPVEAKQAGEAAKKGRT